MPAKKSRRLSRRNRKTRRGRRVQKGGDNIKHACKMPYPTGEPAALKNNAGELPDESIQALKQSIAALPESSFLILKIGSNDSEGVKSGKFRNAEFGMSDGTKGREGYHYLEIPFSNTGAEGGKSTVVDIKQPASSRVILRSTNQINAMIGDKEDGTLFAISPIPKYEEFEYPFLVPSKEGNIATAFFGNIAKKLQRKLYTQAFFPLTIKGKNKEILDLFVNRAEPLIVFNAMASSCYTSMKYIVDCRKLAKRETIYMGLCDTLTDNNIHCDVQAPIYPNRDESCKNIA